MCFTIQLRGEIGRQLVKAPMAAAISPFMISPHPPNGWWSGRDFNLRPPAL